MKRIAVTLFLIAATTFADDVPIPAPKMGPRVDALVHEALPVCSSNDKLTVTVAALRHKLPPNMIGEAIRVESPRQSCAGQWIAVKTTEGGFFWGLPWFLDGLTGPIDAKLKKFGWDNLQQNFEPAIDIHKTRDGLFKVTLSQITEHGKVPVAAEVDRDGTMLFIGNFHALDTSYAESRLKIFQPYLDNSPTTGAAKPVVTIIEFSDFECPSCQLHSGDLKPVLEKYGSQVRYIRFDFPLMSLHPWAFSAAIAGRAIYRQKPDAFWEFKKDVYANQDKLNAFVFDGFARGFAQDHDLDLKKYDADINSPDIQNLILAGVGAAFANDIRATPTYLVNGISVDPGDNGKALESYVAGLLKK